MLPLYSSYSFLLGCSKKIIGSNSLLYSLIQLTKFCYSSRPIFTVAFPWMFLFAETKKRIQILNRSPWKLFSCWAGIEQRVALLVVHHCHIIESLYLDRPTWQTSFGSAAAPLHCPVTLQHINCITNQWRKTAKTAYGTRFVVSDGFVFPQFLFSFFFHSCFFSIIRWSCERESYPWYRVCSH